MKNRWPTRPAPKCVSRESLPGRGGTGEVLASCTPGPTLDVHRMFREATSCSSFLFETVIYFIFNWIHLTSRDGLVLRMIQVFRESALSPRLDSEDGRRSRVSVNDICLYHCLQIEIGPILRRFFQHRIQIGWIGYHLTGCFGSFA